MTLNIFVQSKPENGYLAKILGWPEIIVEGKTKEEAIEKIKTELDFRLAEGEIIRLQYKPPTGMHPWLKFAGAWKDDPTFDDFLEELRANREESNKEWNR